MTFAVDAEVGYAPTIEVVELGGVFNVPFFHFVADVI
jgi:hypothetical protein